MANKHSSASRVWAAGGLVFAAVMMLVVGAWQIFVGIAAIAKSGIFVVTPNYTYNIDTTTWGWIHLILGILTLVGGLFLFTGAAWARALGIILAVLVAINNFIFLPYYPLWSLVVIALCVFVIWALATADYPHDPEELTAAEMAGYQAGATQPNVGSVNPPDAGPHPTPTG